MWRVLGGYHPERLPFALAVQPVEDIGMLLELLITIRDALNEPEAA